MKIMNGRMKKEMRFIRKKMRNALVSKHERKETKEN